MLSEGQKDIAMHYQATTDKDMKGTVMSSKGPKDMAMRYQATTDKDMKDTLILLTGLEDIVICTKLHQTKT